MAGRSRIEWTEATWNPIAGCSVVSPGCTNCYAMRRVAPRLSANRATPHYAGTVQRSKGGPVWTGRIGIAGDKVLQAPLGWRKPRMIFVNSTSDLFHPDVPDEVIDRVFAVMALCPQHTFQVLTKRPERMREWFAEQWQPAPARDVTIFGDTIHLPAEARGEDRRDQVEAAIEDLLLDKTLKHRFADTENPAHWTDAVELKVTQFAWPLPNVWLGTSVEDQVRTNERIPHLLETPAAVRFISAEPLLGPIDLTRVCLVPQKPGSARAGIHQNVLAGRFFESGMPAWDRYNEDGTAAPGARPGKLDWVIVGGESGAGARPMQAEWARSLRDQCADTEVPFFFKQWGEYQPTSDANGPYMMRVSKWEAHRRLDGVEHNSLPEGRG
jgi:protein gp37